jgi:hypothetical protein
VTQGESEPTPGTVDRSAPRTLFAIVGGPLAWAVHFLGAYALVAVGCVAGWGGVRASLALGTVALGGVATAATLAAWRAWRRSSATQHWDEALLEPRGWFAFLMLTGVGLGLLSVVTILLEGLGTLWLSVCDWRPF